ncbi:unnamed protein product [Ostreobium quekettii]|uniref:RING-type E3 ubiquitin transferase n=1 Tax=Ostreobium quekettii TaxID=121088 RepID=A0A8S1IW56_9CHLO|nr:unnamed protein product [Ostreobium quekettii]|eukprot:evm.model.scf_181EXC.14 EVM.evm.TU.scf_181EXC.14   scf_181EXC:92354-92932(-)
MDTPHGARPCDPEEDLCCGCLPPALLPRWMRTGLAPAGSPTYAPPLVVSPNDSFGSPGQGASEDELGRLLNPAAGRPVGKLVPARVARELEGVAQSGGNGSGKHKHRSGKGGKSGESRRLGGRASNSERGPGATDDDDDDICPTCLEPYPADNPKIFAACGHHFHLSCIYEWLERSRTCPVCLKPMKFEEQS